MAAIYLLLGSNTGDNHKNLEYAKKFISERIGNVVCSSSLYETEPWGNPDQPVFLNQVLKVETKLSPENLLSEVLEIETAIGSIRLEKWAPRTIDVDVLYYDDEIIVKTDLKIPHSQLHLRRFTLTPLVEIAPDFIHPVFNLSNKQLLERCEDKLSVIKIPSSK